MQGYLCGCHKSRFLEPSIKWCGRICSGARVPHNPRWIQGLLEMRTSETVGELMHFLPAANWTGTQRRQFAEVKSPLQALMAERLVGTRRTKHVVKRRALKAKDWITGRIRAWKTVRRLLKEQVQLG